MFQIKRGIATWLCVLMVMPASILLEDGTADTVEEQITALRDRMIQAEAAAAIPENREDAAATDKVYQVAVGDSISMGNEQKLTVTAFDFAEKFFYSPAGGFSTLTLSAKTGYLLVQLYIQLENGGSMDLHTSRVLDATIYCGEDFINEAQNSLFYLSSRGVYTGSLKSVAPKGEAAGCLLFAVPDDTDRSEEQMIVRFQFGSCIYDYILRPASDERSEPGRLSQVN